MEIDLVRWAREVIALAPAAEIDELEVRDTETLISVKISAAGWKGRLLFRESPHDFAEDIRAALAAHLKLMAAYHESAAAVAKALAETGGAPSATSG